MKQLPSFITDDSETLKIEEVIDYFLSWTIRCSDQKYAEEKLIHEYSKMILSKIIFDDENELKTKVVSNVKTWKQWMNIDVCCHLEIDDKKFVLIIENKMYSSIREGQLLKYITIANNYYLDKPEFEKKFIFIRPDYEHENKYNEKKICQNEGYQYYNIDELQQILPKVKTKNALFDEFWFNWK